MTTTSALISDAIERVRGDGVRGDGVRGDVRAAARFPDRIVDEGWDPPVALGVRLVSVINDGAQHVGQAAFIQGVPARRSAHG